MKTINQRTGNEFIEKLTRILFIQAKIEIKKDENGKKKQDKKVQGKSTPKAI